MAIAADNASGNEVNRQKFSGDEIFVATTTFPWKSENFAYLSILYKHNLV
jgi:hypothetical protein